MLMFGLYVIFKPNNPDSGATPPPPTGHSNVAVVTPSADVHHAVEVKPQPTPKPIVPPRATSAKLQASPRG